MNLNRDMIVKRFEKLDDLLQKLNEFKKISKEKFLKDTTIQLSAQRALEVCINICIDVGSHILSLSKTGTPETYSQIFEKLEVLKIIDAKRKASLVEMIKFRNLLGHLYMEIDNETMYEIIKTKLDVFNSFKKDIYSKFKSDLLNEK